MVNIEPGDGPETIPADAEPPKKSKLPMVAMLLTFAVPICALGLGSGFRGAASSFFLGCLLISPLLGMLTGLAALCLGKERLGAGGFIMSLTTVVVPLLALIWIVVLVFRTVTGALSSGM